MKWLLRYLLLILLGVAPFTDTGAQEVRKVPDSVTEAMKKQRDFLYANDPSYWEKDKPQDRSLLSKFFEFLGSPVMKVVLYIVLGLIILFIIYQVAVVNNFFVFSRTKRNKKKEEGEDGEIVPLDIDEKIRDAIGKGQYRMAVRYLYLKTLAVLGEKNHIKLHAKSTNNDYLIQMRQSPVFGEFAALTRVYEYVWYGEFMPGQQQFEKIHNNFNQFISRR